MGALPIETRLVALNPLERDSLAYNWLHERANDCRNKEELYHLVTDSTSFLPEVRVALAVLLFQSQSANKILTLTSRAYLVALSWRSDAFILLWIELACMLGHGESVRACARYLNKIARARVEAVHTTGSWARLHHNLWL